MPKKKIKGKSRLAIDFRSPEALLDWVGEASSMGLIPPPADVFAMDYLDQRDRDGGVGLASTFLLANPRDRVGGTSLRELLGRGRS